MKASAFLQPSSRRKPGESRDPSFNSVMVVKWIPAFAGMTSKRDQRSELDRRVEPQETQQVGFAQAALGGIGSGGFIGRQRHRRPCRPRRDQRRGGEDSEKQDRRCSRPPRPHGVAPPLAAKEAGRGRPPSPRRAPLLYGAGVSVMAAMPPATLSP